MLVTQRATGEDPARIAVEAPVTWAYLQRHAALLDRRASSIYRKRPRFAVFGVGAYTFATWKVAISGMYKRLGFTVVGPRSGKPVVLDDTTYFLPFADRAEAESVAQALRSDAAVEFYTSLIFWDAKRPITAEVLRELRIEALPGAGGTA